MLTRYRARIVQSSDSEYLLLAGNCYTLNWLVALTLAALQFLLAPFLANFYAAPQLTALLQCMAVSYLLYPFVAMKVALLQRSSQFKHIGIVSSLAIAGDNLATAIFALMGFGLYSVAYAKIIAACIWCIGFWNAKVPAFKPAFNPKHVSKLLGFSISVMCSELTRSFRTQVDVLIAGRILAPEVFGLYSFAKSAGVGFALSANQAFVSAIYPRLAEAQRNATLCKQIKIIIALATGLSVVFIIQSLAATIYVPLLFNNEFEQAAALVSILCLCAIPMLATDILSLCMRVQYKLVTEILYQLALLTGCATLLLIMHPKSALDFALATTATTAGIVLLTSILFTAATRYRRQIHNCVTPN